MPSGFAGIVPEFYLVAAVAVEEGSKEVCNGGGFTLTRVMWGVESLFGRGEGVCDENNAVNIKRGSLSNSKTNGHQFGIWGCDIPKCSFRWDDLNTLVPAVSDWNSLKRFVWFDTGIRYNDNGIWLLESILIIEFIKKQKKYSHVKFHILERKIYSMVYVEFWYRWTSAK